MMLTRTAHEIAWTVQATARGHRFASIRLSAPQSGKSVCKRARAWTAAPQPCKRCRAFRPHSAPLQAAVSPYSAKHCSKRKKES